jgi:phosphoribosylanthranilate isomerase
MNHFRIKVCGITRLKDAQLADSLGADLLGFIFYKRSLRHISVSAAGKIAEKLPPTIDKVGVFVEPAKTQILSAVEKLNLEYVQLHGKISPTLIKVLQKKGVKVIQSFHVQNLNSYKAIFKCKADVIQLDNSNQYIPGGTGSQFDWALKPPKRIPNLMLSGGINIKNVKDGVSQFKPLIIDVNSGVESQAGIKSAAKLKQFFKFCNNLRYGTQA